jgi:RNA polymerase sigma-70 factor (ECF subfamily)
MPVLARKARKPQTPAEWTDRQMLRRVLDNSEEGWTEMLRRYRPLIYRCITKVTNKHAPHLSSADLDEIYADVLMNLLRDDMRKLRMFNPRRGTKLSSWVGMISINSAYDFLRSASRRPLLDKINGSPEPADDDNGDRSPLEVLMEKERWNHLNQALTDFSDRDRTFLSLYYEQGMEAAEVAAEMSISLKTVYSKKHKIRAHLRRCVSAFGSDSAIADLVATPA